jgi:hypothetical protein
MSPKVENPDIDPLENDSNRPIRSWESTTPTLESRNYFTVLVHYSAEIDPIGVFRNGATAIEFSENNGSKRLHYWLRVIPI